MTMIMDYATTMHSLISEVNRYFIGKILAGDFETVSRDQYHAVIKIDGKYRLKFWTANCIEFFRPDFNERDRGFICLSFADEEERENVFRAICDKTEETDR